MHPGPFARTQGIGAGGPASYHDNGQRITVFAARDCRRIAFQTANMLFSATARPDCAGCSGLRDRTISPSQGITTTSSIRSLILDLSVYPQPICRVATSSNNLGSRLSRERRITRSPPSMRKVMLLEKASGPVVGGPRQVTAFIWRCRGGSQLRSASTSSMTPAARTMSPASR